MMTGHKVVDEITKINFTGNIIPMSWFEAIRFDNGKPDTVAIIILSDIIYWYRAREERDEYTGMVTAYKKKFKADKLQKYYSALAKQYGFTKRQVQDAINRLVKQGIITVELRTVTPPNGTKIGNVPFIEPVPSAVLGITYPITLERERLSHPNGTPITLEREYTEITTEIDHNNDDRQEKLSTRKKAFEEYKNGLK